LDLVPGSQPEYSADAGELPGSTGQRPRNALYGGLQQLHIIGVETRIWYGHGMSDYQLLYQHKTNDGWMQGTVGWHEAGWGYNEQYTHRAADGYEVDGIQLALYPGDSVVAMRVHTRPKVA